MPRKSLAVERRAQILDAFTRCVATHGLEGTSLEQIAREAGVKRSILRHYVGNREDLIHALAERVAERYRAQLVRLAAATSTRTLLGYLFPTDPTPPAEMLAVEALIATSDQRPQVRDRIRALIDETVEATVDVLRRTHPDAPSGRRWTVAAGLVALSFNHDSLSPLQLPAKHGRAARANARALLDSL
ncbi:MAG: TetR/AcrR family transcriptional regulator [Planctomycetota bacterium]